LAFCSYWSALHPIQFQAQQPLRHLNSRIKFRVKSFRQLHNFPFGARWSQLIPGWPGAIQCPEGMKRAWLHGGRTCYFFLAHKRKLQDWRVIFTSLHQKKYHFSCHDESVSILYVKVLFLVVWKLLDYLC
jgi:hypothetical protein